MTISYFKEKGFKVTTSDILTFANYFQISKLQFNTSPKFRNLHLHLNTKNNSDLLHIINSYKAGDGWFVEEFANKRTFFTVANAQRIEAIRQKIKEWDQKNLITNNEKAFLLASLINSMDKIANTAGTYYAYLKEFNRKSIQPFKYQFIQPAKGKYKGTSIIGEASQILSTTKYDVVYLDPPYNSRSYSRYYHLPEVIAKQIEPTVSGKSGISDTCHIDSDYNKKCQATTSFQKLIKNTTSKIVVLQYTDNGLIPKEAIYDILKEEGEVKDFYINSLGYSTKATNRNDKHHIYFLLR